MKKISLAVIGMYVSVLSAFSQNPAAKDTSYKNRRLKIDEINFVSGYYRQNGNNSAVTGGIGSEKLTDFANTLELKLIKYDHKYHKHTFTGELGADTYTSASSDKIDPVTISSGSKDDTRIYPSLSWNVLNEQKNRTFGAALSYSTEFDYKSVGAALNFAKTSKDKNSEIAIKLQAYLDTWRVIYASELRPPHYGTGAIGGGPVHYTPRNSFSASFTFSQVVNTQLQVLFVLEPTYQHGLLATKYQRVFFNDDSERSETLPDDRFKLPVGLRANCFFGDNFILKSYYRFYIDNWGLKAQTIELETPIKITPFFSVSPFYRFYSQNAVDYFAPYSEHKVSEIYFTSDYDLSKFTSHFLGAGIRIAPPKGVFNIKQWNSLELRYGHYIRSTGLHSNILSLHVKFK